MKASRSVRYLCQAALALGSVFSAVSIPAQILPGDTSGGAGGVPGYPDKLGAYDSREVGMLPRYCAYTQFFRDRVGHNPTEVERWYSRMGPSFNHMHHYCWGLMKTNRALFLTRTEYYRRFYLNDAISEFDYVIRNATPNFVMLPEIFTKKGENLIRVGRGPDAVRDLQRAIELKPDYWPPYAALGDYFKETGDLAQAREWLEKGLSASPNTKALKRRLTELDAPQSRDKSDPSKRRVPK